RTLRRDALDVQTTAARAGDGAPRRAPDRVRTPPPGGPPRDPPPRGDGTRRPDRCARRSRRADRGARAAPEPHAPRPRGPGAARRGHPLGAPCRSSSRHRLTRRGDARFSSLERRAELRQTAGDPARDRPRRQVERVADRLVALVSREEAIEDVAAVAPEPV